MEYQFRSGASNLAADCGEYDTPHRDLYHSKKQCLDGGAVPTAIGPTPRDDTAVGFSVSLIDAIDDHSESIAAVGIVYEQKTS